MMCVCICLLVNYTVHTKSISWRNVFGLKMALQWGRHYKLINIDEGINWIECY